MDIILMARELGKALQKDDRWISMRLAQQCTEQDEELQALIKRFDKCRASLNNEMQSSDRDGEKIRQKNDETKALYQEIMSHKRMVEFSSKQEEVNEMLQFINQIISGSAEGLNPDEIQYQEKCGGGCSGCSGCG